MNGELLKTRMIVLLVLLLSGILHAANDDTSAKAPPHVFVDDGACPFECCKYRQWTVEKPTTLVDQPNGKRVIGKLAKGDVVDGLTGKVISTPIVAKADRDIPETPIKMGDTFYVLHYGGEGYWKVWFQGKITSVHQSVMDVPHPKAEWWVKIKDAHGNVGWALSQGNFAHQDACE
jgi:hypothetical protein